MAALNWNREHSTGFSGAIKTGSDKIHVRQSYRLKKRTYLVTIGNRDSHGYSSISTTIATTQSASPRRGKRPLNFAANPEGCSKCDM